MPRRDQLIGKLNSIGFSFHSQTPRGSFFRKGTVYVHIRSTQNHPETAVRSILRQAGLTDAEIERFIRECTV